MEHEKYFETTQQCEKYLDDMALYFLKLAPGTRKMVSDLTDLPEKFISCVKHLMGTWDFNQIIQFNIDEKEIRKNFKPNPGILVITNNE
jgi:hypothetical protein